MMHDLVLITLNWLFKNLGRYSPSLGRGRSAGYLTVCTRDIVVSGGFQGWTADGPLANFKVVPETMFVSGGVELLTADGPHLGRGQSARV